MRVLTKVGDIFSVKINNDEKKYFQLIAFDLTELNSDVIRSFKQIYSINDIPKLSEIVTGEIEFYTHCVTKAGVKLGLWEKVGNYKDIGDLDIFFRRSGDYGNYQKKISENWYIYKINQMSIKVGKLPDIYRNTEIGGVNPPYLVFHRIRTGELGFSYPDFE